MATKKEDPAPVPTPMPATGGAYIWDEARNTWVPDVAPPAKEGEK